MTAADLSEVKRVAKYQAFRLRRPELEDDFVSESCLRLVQRPLPDDADHRRRYIRQTVGWSVTDYMRTISVTPRRVLAKIKAGVALTSKERAKVGHVESTDFTQDWVKELSAPATEADKPDVRAMLAKIGAAHSVEFYVLTLQYIHGALLSEIADTLGVTESRVCQISQKGIDLLKIVAEEQ